MPVIPGLPSLIQGLTRKLLLGISPERGEW